jgi:hypothetical protein
LGLFLQALARPLFEGNDI